jgi:hypothetical protein
MGLARVLAAVLAWGVTFPVSTPARAHDDAAAAAAQLADVFSQIGDQIYEECIFELSPEQLEVQHALITAYVENGASSALARQLAVKQIQPPKPSPKCEMIRTQPTAPPETIPGWSTTLDQQEAEAPPIKTEPKVAARPEPKPKKPVKDLPPASVLLADKKPLQMWDCEPGVDYVTVKLGSYHRKLSGGEICKPFKDVVNAVPASAGKFKLGYTIRTGRLFVDSDGSAANGRTIAWGLSGRDLCRNDPDPDCFAARAVGPLPPGEYSFASDPKYRVSWGPKTKRNVAGIYLKTLWNQERFSPEHIKAIRKRGNIAIHMRLKGEMSEACIGMEPKGWSYVASLIKEGRATGVNVYIDEPHPQVAEAPPVIEGSSFSLTSLFK